MKNTKEQSKAKTGGAPKTTGPSATSAPSNTKPPAGKTGTTPAESSGKPKS